MIRRAAAASIPRAIHAATDRKTSSMLPQHASRSMSAPTRSSPQDEKQAYRKGQPKASDNHSGRTHGKWPDVLSSSLHSRFGAVAGILQHVFRSKSANQRQASVKNERVVHKSDDGDEAGNNLHRA